MELVKVVPMSKHLAMRCRVSEHETLHVDLLNVRI
jgi:hypothetical protein